MQAIKSGTVLAGRYALERRLGAAGDIEVWLASDRAAGVRVALKILVRNPDRSAELRREWQVGLRLMHPHIVRVFEFHAADADAPACFSLQYIDGPTLDVLTGAPLADILAPVGLIADALRYAHQKDIVHRDLKAANVLLDGNGAPCIIDFGVAAASGDAPGGGSLIAASPQQLDGEPARPADDVFALGGLVYELISGRSPYPSLATAEAIRSEVPAPLRTADGGEPPAEVAALVADMLAKDPAGRPTAATVTERLQAAGYAPGAAPRKYVGEAAARHDVSIDSDRAFARHRAEPAAPPPVPAGGQRGLSPTVVGAALAALLVALLGVVFLLPRSIKPAPPPETAVVADEAPPEAAADEPAALPERDERVQARQATEEVLGRLLATVKTLEGRAVDRWGGVPWQQSQAAYAAGDEAYIAQNYAEATARYTEALERVEPLVSQVDTVFASTLAEAREALDNGDAVDAVRLYELAVAITPGHAGARAGLERARNLDRVLALTEQGLQLERNLELDAARDSFARAVEIDPQWATAVDGLARVNESIRQMNFEARMSEGLNALAQNDYAGARAAFRMAQALDPSSSEPADGLLQVDQGLRLGEIAMLEEQAAALEENEQWDEAVATYEKILELDDTLAFARDGLTRSRARVRLHAQLQGYLDEPDALSADRTLQRATQLVVDIARMDTVGPRLAEERDELARLLKRAATKLTVTLVSDEMTNVSIYKVGKLGTFNRTELDLRPGTYVAVGSRPGYRDVRLEFRVAPEIAMEPVVVQCEEPI